MCHTFFYLYCCQRNPLQRRCRNEVFSSLRFSRWCAYIRCITHSASLETESEWRHRLEMRKRCARPDDISIEVSNSFWQRNNQLHDFSLTLDRFLNVSGTFLSLHKCCWYVLSLYLNCVTLIWRRMISIFGYKRVSMYCFWSRSCAVIVCKDFIRTIMSEYSDSEVDR